MGRRFTYLFAAVVLLAFVGCTVVSAVSVEAEREGLVSEGKSFHLGPVAKKPVVNRNPVGQPNIAGIILLLVELRQFVTCFPDQHLLVCLCTLLCSPSPASSLYPYCSRCPAHINHVPCSSIILIRTPLTNTLALTLIQSIAAQVSLRRVIPNAQPKRASVSP